MAVRLVQIAMNAQDDAAIGRFWAEALGWGMSSEGPGVTNLEPEGFAYPDPAAVCIDILRVPEPKTVKNRVHIDLATTSAAQQESLVARLRDLGAVPADIGQGDVSWAVLADPEGNERFCAAALCARRRALPRVSPHARREDREEPHPPRPGALPR